MQSRPRDRPRPSAQGGVLPTWQMESRKLNDLSTVRQLGRAGGLGDSWGTLVMIREGLGESFPGAGNIVSQPVWSFQGVCFGIVL